MSDDTSHDPAMVAASTLTGVVATIVQQLVRAGSVDAAALRARLDAFVAQTAEQPVADRALIQQIVENIKLGITLGARERDDQRGQ